MNSFTKTIIIFIINFLIGYFINLFAIKYMSFIFDNIFTNIMYFVMLYNIASITGNIILTYLSKDDFKFKMEQFTKNKEL